MKRGLGLGISLAAALILLLAVNVIGSMTFSGAQADFTEEKLFTLNPGTKQMLDRLKDNVSMKLFYSKSAISEIPQLKQYAERAIGLLHRFESASGGKIKLEVLEPRPDTETEEYAIKYGLRGVAGLVQENLYFGLVLINDVGKEATIPFLTPDRESSLEYDIARLIENLTTTEKKKIGVISSLPVMGAGDDPMAQYSGQPPTPAWVFIDELKKQYTVTKVADDADAIDGTLDLLLVIHPKAASDKLQFAIDQFVLKGGHAVLCVDPLSYEELANFQSPNPQERMSAAFDSNLPKLFKAWGIEMEDKKLAADTSLATPIAPNVKHPTFLSLGEGQNNPEDIISGNADKLLFGNAGSLVIDEDAAKKNGLKYTWLLRTTDAGGVVDSMNVQFGSSPDIIERDIKKAGKPLNLGIKIMGKFKTAFPEGQPKPEATDSAETKPEDVGPKTWLTEGKEDNTIVVFSDADFLTDRFSVTKQNFFGQMMVQVINDNIAMGMNAAEQLMGAPELVALRMRGKSNRPFTMVQALEKEAQDKWKDSEERLVKKEEETMQKLSELQSGKSEEAQAVLSPAQEQEIQKYRDELADNKKELRQVRLNLRENIEALGTRIKIVNVALVPLLVLLAGFVPVLWRHRKMKRA